MSSCDKEDLRLLDEPENEIKPDDDIKPLPELDVMAIPEGIFTSESNFYVNPQYLCGISNPYYKPDDVYTHQVDLLPIGVKVDIKITGKETARLTISGGEFNLGSVPGVKSARTLKVAPLLGDDSEYTFDMKLINLRRYDNSYYYIGYTVYLQDSPWKLLNISAKICWHTDHWEWDNTMLTYSQDWHLEIKERYNSGFRWPYDIVWPHYNDYKIWNVSNFIFDWESSIWDSLNIDNLTAAQMLQIVADTKYIPAHILSNYDLTSYGEDALFSWNDYISRITKPKKQSQWGNILLSNFGFSKGNINGLVYTCKPIMGFTDICEFDLYVSPGSFFMDKGYFYMGKDYNSIDIGVEPKDILSYYIKKSDRYVYRYPNHEEADLNDYLSKFLLLLDNGGNLKTLINVEFTGTNNWSSDDSWLFYLHDEKIANEILRLLLEPLITNSELKNNFMTAITKDPNLSAYQSVISKFLDKANDLLDHTTKLKFGVYVWTYTMIY